jgi:hypothetical protein
MLGSILKASSLATSTNAQLTKDLERKSRALENISRSFIDRGKKLKIFSFYETEKMDLMNCKVNIKPPARHAEGTFDSKLPR